MSVVTGPAARGAAERGAEGAVTHERVDQPPQARVVDLAREVLQEAVELVEVPEGDGEELGGIGGAILHPGDGRELGVQLVAEALDAAGDLDEIAAFEAAAEVVRVAEDPRRDR